MKRERKKQLGKGVNDANSKPCMEQAYLSTNLSMLPRLVLASTPAPPIFLHPPLAQLLHIQPPHMLHQASRGQHIPIQCHAETKSRPDKVNIRKGVI